MRESTPRRALDATHLEVLRLMVVGRSRLAIAQELHMGSRTVDCRRRDIRDVLATTRTVCLGVRAIRSGLVDSGNPIAHAHAVGSWALPTARAAKLLRRLADNLSVEEAGMAAGISASTVRDDLRRLAAANGVYQPIHIGALAEALGWLHVPDLLIPVDMHRARLTKFADLTGVPCSRSPALITFGSEVSEAAVAITLRQIPLGLTPPAPSRKREP